MSAGMSVSYDQARRELGVKIRAFGRKQSAGPCRAFDAVDVVGASAPERTASNLNGCQIPARREPVMSVCKKQLLSVQGNLQTKDPARLGDGPHLMQHAEAVCRFMKRRTRRPQQ